MFHSDAFLTVCTHSFTLLFFSLSIQLRAAFYALKQVQENALISILLNYYCMSFSMCNKHWCHKIRDILMSKKEHDKILFGDNIPRDIEPSIWSILY